MITTIDETGVLNNYAAEPQMYFAEYPSADKQQRYLVQGAAAATFFIGLLTVALMAS